MIVLVMGTTGAGKTTVGKLLAEKLGWIFLDADDFHPAANIEKMKQGIPLDDADRVPWLAAMHEELARQNAIGKSCVLTSWRGTETLQAKEFWPDNFATSKNPMMPLSSRSA